MDKIIPDKEILEKSFQLIKEKKTVIERECALLQEADKFNIPFEKYEALFNLYIKGKTNEEILEYPSVDTKHWYSTFLLWKQWFIKNKFQLLCIIFSFLLEKGAILSVGLAAIQYIISIPEKNRQAESQKIQSHYQSWQVIYSLPKTKEKNCGEDIISGNRAKVEALQLLNKDKVNMSDIQLIKESLKEIELKNAKLTNANFYCTNLWKANFQKSDLRMAKFESANLNDSNLEETQLTLANFNSAYLIGVKFNNAELQSAKFQNSNLKDATFQGAKLCDSVHIKLCADFRGAKNIPIEQIKLAQGWEKAHYDEDIRQKLGLPREDTSTDKKQ